VQKLLDSDWPKNSAKKGNQVQNKVISAKCKVTQCMYYRMLIGCQNNTCWREPIKLAPKQSNIALKLFAKIMAASFQRFQKATEKKYSRL